MSQSEDREITDRAQRIASSAHPDDEMWPTTALARRIEHFISRVGDFVSFIWLLLLAVIILNVVLRYAFASGRIELEELQWHLYAVGFLCGISYCVPSDSHVRVDFLRERMQPRMRAWIELYGLLLLVIPFVLLVVLSSLPFVSEAWRTSEISASASGLTHRVIIKAALPTAMLAVGLACIARIMRVGRFLFGDTQRADTLRQRGR